MTDQERDALRGVLERASQYVGCGDNSCLFRKPKGMATNGGCRCFERNGQQKPGQVAALAALYRQVAKMVDA